jgi:hypothetical protein
VVGLVAGSRHVETGCRVVLDSNTFVFGGGTLMLGPFVASIFTLGGCAVKLFLENGVLTQNLCVPAADGIPKMERHAPCSY